MLRQELVRQGDFLFRYRSYLPFLLLPGAALAYSGSLVAGTSNDTPWRLTCLGVSLLGLAVRVYVAGTIAAGTSGRNTTSQGAHSINMRGMYSLVRHPLYFANFLVYLGIVLSVANVWFILFAICMFWLYYERIMLAEETFIERLHGPDYLGWAQRTPAFFPRLTGWQSPELPFSPRAALLREFHTLFQTIAIFALLALIEATWVRSIAFPLWVLDEPLWPRMFMASLVFYLCTRLIKKKTGWLKVEGR